MHPDSGLELSIVMPCLNEARTLPLCIQKAQSFLTAHKINGEIVIADNGSTDDSVVLAQNMGARVISVAEKGYGAALAGGIEAARGRFVIIGDSDDSYDFTDLSTFLNKLHEGFDLVIGNRFKGAIKPDAMPFLNRYIGNPVLSYIGRLFFKIPIGDFHCGLRGFSREALLALELRTTGMEYASEMIVRASFAGLRMTEVPVTLWPDGRSHSPHLHPWRDGWRHLRFLLIYSPRWLYLYPGLAMIFFGLLTSALLLPGPVMIADGVGLDVHTLLVGAASLLLGVQSITFGLMARYYAQQSGMQSRFSRSDKWIDALKLEHMLALAALMVASGLAGVFAALHKWSAVDFGALDYRDAMRILIFSVTCILGGFQLGFAGFLLGVMQIQKRK